MSLANSTNGPRRSHHADAMPRRGSAQPPRKSVAAIAANANAVPNSPMKKKRKRKPVYSTMYPATSSLSATGMSNGVCVSSACAATRKRQKPMNCVRMNGLPMPSQPKIEPVLLGGDDALQVHRAGLDDHADDREQQRQLVGDELRGGAQRAEQRELVGARPAGHEHADDREARHRQRVEHADVEVLDDESGPGRDHEEDEERRDHDDRGREREDAPVGLARA